MATEVRVRRVAAVLAGIVVLGVAAIAAINRPVDPAGRGRTVVIPPGASSSEIGNVLRSTGVVRRSSHFVLAVRARRLTRALEGGEYARSPWRTLLAVDDVISRGQ